MAVRSFTSNIDLPISFSGGAPRRRLLARFSEVDRMAFPFPTADDHGDGAGLISQAPRPSMS